MFEPIQGEAGVIVPDDFMEQVSQIFAPNLMF